MSQPDTTTFFDLSPEPHAVLGADGALLAANDAFRFIIGRTGAEIVAEGAESFIHAEDLACWRAAIHAMPAAAGPAAICVRCRVANGRWRWLEWTCSRGTDSTIFATAKDVTELRADSQRLAQLEAQMDAVTAEVWLLDAEGRVVQANGYVSTLLGLEERAMIGKRREDVKPG
jgi:PAS domain S-box-containing protein